MYARPFMNQIIHVTGAASGIGRAAALCLCKKGTPVYGIARHAQDTETSFPGGGSLTLLRGDVTDPASLKGAV